MKMNERLWQSLRCCCMQTAIEMLKPWVEERALPGEVELLIDACPPALRPRLTLLLGDLLSGWPRAVLAVPVLMLAGRCGDTPPGARRVVLPGPSGERGFAEGVVFAGWLDKSALLLAQGVLGGDQRLAEVSVAIGRVDCALAVFQADEGVEAGNVEIPILWFAEVLAGLPVELRMQAGEVAEGYAAGLEVARAMWRAAGGAWMGMQEEVFATRGELLAGVVAGQVFAGARMS